MTTAKHEITDQELALIVRLREEIAKGDGEAFEELATLEPDLILPDTELQVPDSELITPGEEQEDDVTKQEQEEADWFASLPPKEQRLLIKQTEALGTLVRSITFFEGKKGRGKSLAALAMSYQMREFFGMPVVVIGSSMDMTDDYGPYTYLDEREFIGNLDSITKVTKSTDQDTVDNAVETALGNMGVTVYDSLLIFDEAYKLFDARTPSDKLVRVFGYFVAQSRHYKATIFITSPNRDMIDKRVRRQIDYFGRCFTNKKTGITTVRLRGGAESWKMRIFGPNYYHMYNSWNLLGYRAKHLQIKDAL